MKLVAILPITVPVPMFIKLHLNHLHSVFEKITIVTQGALIIINTSSMVMTHYGMELQLVVDQLTPAAL